MNDIHEVGTLILFASAAALLAVLSNRLSERIRVPAPALFLIAGAAVATALPRVVELPILTVQRVVTLALIPILFDGGLQLGWRRFRAAGGAIAWIGVAGTLVTAGAVALAAHLLFGLPWLLALLLGTALAPTDPAVVFSVLGRREISGRSGTILEGESGANDPVGVALMVSLLAAAGINGGHAIGVGVAHFALQMGVGAVVGVAGGFGLLALMRFLPLPSASLYPVRTLAGAGVIYGLATVVDGSGFLAVFLAGIVIGDARAPYKREIEGFHSALASLGEIVAFALLGLTVSLPSLAHGWVWAVGLGLAALLAFVIRPLALGLLMIPIQLGRGERLFVWWAGLKGAVPILLGTFIVTAAVPDARRVYEIIFVVVAFSVLVQGGLVPAVGRLLRVPIRLVAPEPWALGMRLRTEPEGIRRYSVQPGSRADGSTVADLPVGEDFWISIVSREGRLVQVRGDTVLHAGDEVLTLTDPGGAEVTGLFQADRSTESRNSA